MGVGTLKQVGTIAASLSLGHTTELPKVCSCHSPISETEHDPCQGKCEGSSFKCYLATEMLCACLSVLLY